MWSSVNLLLVMLSINSNTVLITPERKLLILTTVTVGISDFSGNKRALFGSFWVSSLKRLTFVPLYA